MKIELKHRPAFAMALVHLEPGESVVAEAGAMVTKSTHVKIHTGTRTEKKGGLLGGLAKGLKRMVAGESFFVNKFTTEGAPGEVTFAPTFPGDIEVHHLSSSTGLMLQSSAFLCSEEGVQVDAKWGGAKTFFGGEGLVMLKATGAGAIAFNAFGGVEKVQIDGDLTIDTGHIVAFGDSLQFSVRKFGSWKSFLFGGEGLVCEFSGKGSLWLQTRNPVEFGTRIGSRLPPRN